MVCGTERAGRLIEDQIVGVWISATIAQGGNLTLSPSSDWQPVEGSERQRLCMTWLSSAKDKTRCIILYSAGQAACFRGDPLAAKSCRSPAFTERKMKPVSSSHPTDSRWRPRCLILSNSRKADIAEKVDPWPERLLSRLTPRFLTLCENGIVEPDRSCRCTEIPEFCSFHQFREISRLQSSSIT